MTHRFRSGPDFGKTPLTLPRRLEQLGNGSRKSVQRLWRLESNPIIRFHLSLLGNGRLFDRRNTLR
jgi:hypothetical protein